ncbi:MAG: serine/threonine dehydratase [Actinomycetota bacterium]
MSPPELPDAAAIDAAHRLIRPHVRRTPLLAAGSGLVAGVEPILKLELLQHTGSFKPRGAFTTALQLGAGPAGLVAASGGNHGAAVAHVAASLGLAAEIFVPGVSSELKRRRIADLGATVHVVGDVYDDAQAAADEHAAATGALLVHPFDRPEVVAGQATLGRELVEDHPELDDVLVAVGGGGLFAGVVAALPPSIRVVPVEPVAIPSLADAIVAGGPVDVPVAGIASDSLGARRIGRYAHGAASRPNVDPVLHVSDEQIVAAQRLLWDRCRIMSEPGGATAMAGLLAEPDRFAGRRVAVIVCGGNVDPAAFPGAAAPAG